MTDTINELVPIAIQAPVAQIKKKDNIAAYRHMMYEKHREKVLKFMLRPIKCSCGLEVKYSNYHKHLKTNKHLYNKAKFENKI